MVKIRLINRKILSRGIYCLYPPSYSSKNRSINLTSESLSYLLAHCGGFHKILRITRRKSNLLLCRFFSINFEALHFVQVSSYSDIHSPIISIVYSPFLLLIHLTFSFRSSFCIRRIITMKSEQDRVLRNAIFDETYVLHSFYLHGQRERNDQN